MIELDKAIEFAKNKSREIIESGMTHRPILFALAPQDTSIILFDDIDKSIFKQAVGELLRQLQAYAYVFVNEAWVAELDARFPTAQRVLSGEISVSDLPLDDRTEVLIITVAENSKSYRCWSAKIKYTPDDKRYLEEWEEIQGIHEGRLILKEW